jgi:hypothetical protein
MSGASVSIATIRLIRPENSPHLASLNAGCKVYEFM